MYELYKSSCVTVTVRIYILEVPSEKFDLSFGNSDFMTLKSLFISC